ncbi:hypothetical protein IKP13_05425 [bacterium]|nr:hypothetical protein [bacterium]
MKKLQIFIFINLFLIIPLFAEEDEKPFELTVEISEGANAPDWEKALFADHEKKDEKEGGSAGSEEKSAGNKEKKKKEPEKREESDAADTPEEALNKPGEAEKTAETPQNKDEYSPASKNWGEYYGTTPRYDYPIYGKEEKNKGSTVAAKEKEPEIIKEDDPSSLSVDLILQTQHDTEFDPMLSTGVRVNFANIYSTLLVGTDYSTSSQRAYSLGITAGGFYRISDFALKAGLGYKKIWDNTENSNFNDWSLGIEAGGSYNIFSWFALGAGVGMNYSVLKDSGFTDGRFVPTFFADFEFSLIK